MELAGQRSGIIETVLFGKHLLSRTHVNVLQRVCPGSVTSGQRSGLDASMDASASVVLESVEPPDVPSDLNGDVPKPVRVPVGAVRSPLAPSGSR